MRNFLLAAFALVSTVSVGCSAPVDNTQNRGEQQSNLNYPAGPYGYIEGSTIDDYKFLGKMPKDGDYAGVKMDNLYLDQYYNDKKTKLLLIEGSANWCYYCNQEAPSIEKLSTEHKDAGFRAVTVLAEGSTQGVPSDEGDITSWVKKHKFKNTDMAIDPAQRLFQYAPASAFPLHILVDTSNMTIKWLCVGGIGGCDTELAVESALNE